MEGFLKFFYLLIACFLICCCFLVNSKNLSAASQDTFNYQDREIKRSLESLQDLDYQTWQIIVYPSPKGSNDLTLRIVGYPGSLRIDHPTNLVNSGKKWDLKDITKKQN